MLYSIENLQKYKSHKIVDAEPMGIVEYNQFRADYPELRSSVIDVSPGDDSGFHIVYNRDLADEYHSWSPSTAFTEGYSEEPPKDRDQAVRADGNESNVRNKTTDALFD